MDTFKHYRWVMGGWSQHQAAHKLDVSVKSIQRYERGQAPTMALTLIALLAGGELGLIQPEWAGWNLLHGALIAPENTLFSPGEIRAIPHLHSEIAGLRRQVRALEAELTRRPSAGPRRRWTQFEYPSTVYGDKSPNDDYGDQDRSGGERTKKRIGQQ